MRALSAGPVFQSVLIREIAQPQAALSSATRQNCAPLRPMDRGRAHVACSSMSSVSEQLEVQQPLKPDEFMQVSTYTCFRIILTALRKLVEVVTHTVHHVCLMPCDHICIDHGNIEIHQCKSDTGCICSYLPLAFYA